MYKHLDKTSSKLKVRKLSQGTKRFLSQNFNHYLQQANAVKYTQYVHVLCLFANFSDNEEVFIQKEN